MSTWTTKFRGPALVAGLAILAMAAAPGYAGGKSTPKNPPSKSENIGVASGLVVGAAAGGPIGAVFGAAIGGWMGERNNRKLQAIETGKNEANKLASEIDSLNGSLHMLSGKAGDVGSTVQFRTGETLVRDSDRARLAKLGALVADLKGVRVRVSGHADSRGDDALNLSLSQERAEMVARELQQAGVPKDRIIVEGLGERFASTVAGNDDQAFERCVEIRFESNLEAMASN